jgi:hypothetical protein
VMTPGANGKIVLVP